MAASMFTSALPSFHNTHIGHFLTTPINLPSLPPASSFVNLGIYTISAAFLGLFTLFFYRVFLHPLSRYPGPFLAKLTPLHASYHAYKGDRHLLLFNLHKKYGPVVRWAPNSVSINSAVALKEIYGHGPNSRNVLKGGFYKAFPAVKGVHNTHNAIDKSVHGRKRRVLSQAFSENALKGLEGLVLKNVQVFFNVIEERMAKGKDMIVGAGSIGGIDMGEMCSWLTFDIMGELCFGKAFGMLVNESQRFVTELIDKAAHNHYICGNYLPLTTLKLSKLLFPTIAADRWRFILHSRACANDRMAMHAAGQDLDKRDFFHYLLNAIDPETGHGFDKPELWGEANVLMIAGSDTTSTALAASMYYLLQNPEKLQKLQEEVRSKFGNVSEIASGKELNECHYLKACIDEAMRLCPPVPGLLPRQVILPMGITIDLTKEVDENGVPVGGERHHFPQGTVVGVPIYAIHHHELYYPEAFAFQPERWLSSSVSEEAVARAHSAYTPFSIGPRGCIGKSLALMELKLVISRLVLEWDIELVEGVPGKAESWKEGWRVKPEEFPMLDHFTARKEGPIVHFQKRIIV